MGKQNKYDAQHLRNLGLTEKQIANIYDVAVKEAAAIGASIHDFNSEKPFSFSDYPRTKARVDRMIKELQKKMETAIVSGVRSGWTLANNKNNALCDLVFGDNKGMLTKEQERKYYSNNDKALEAFLKRKTAGLNLSDRVWRYTDQFKNEIEMGIDLGLRDGLPAAEMARDLKQYLQYPDKLFRRVRDEHGQLHLSKAAKDFHPGAGVYRSSYKNAMRLARTENNMAYRTADHERWQQLDFVVGVEIRLSNNHTLNGRPFTDICDDLKGKYPKSFKFTGWHPACRCHAVSILKTPEELAQENEAILAGKEPDKSSANEINDVPENFKKWVANNEARIAKAKKQGTLPYFIKDNYKDGSVDSGFSWSSEKRVKSNAEKADIQKQPDAKKNTNLSYQVKKLTNKGEYNMIVDGIISPASINETFLTLLDDSVAINVVNKPNSGSYWMSRNKSITLDNVRRRVSSEWFNKSLVYHEGGHSIADMRNLFQTKEFNDMVIKHANLMKGGNGKLIHDRIIRLHTKINSMRDDVFIKRNITKDDVKEQILGVADTLAALTKGKYGWGHKKRYFSTQSNRNHEYIAHAFENYFAGNTVFKKIMPEIHEDMIKYIKSLISQ